MSDVMFALVSTYGLWIVGASAFVSCLAIPVPTAVVMLAAGGFAASGDLVLWQVWLTAWLAAVMGDQTGFHIGRWGGPPLIDAIARRTGRYKLIAKARQTVQDWGGIGVFFSTWLFTALGPWVNLIAGAARLQRWRFTVWDVAGETIWITTYILLGYGFGSRLEELTDIVADWAGMIASGAVTATLAVFLLLKLRKNRKLKKQAAASQTA